MLATGPPGENGAPAVVHVGVSRREEDTVITPEQRAVDQNVLGMRGVDQTRFRTQFD